MYDYNVKLKDRAKQLRRDMTPWERHLWYDFLRTYEVKIYRQKMIGNFIADFCCSKAKLVIELDGSGHYQEEQKARDKERTVELGKLGFSVIRIANNDIDNNFYGVCEYIDREIRKRLKTPPPFGLLCPPDTIQPLTGRQRGRLEIMTELQRQLFALQDEKYREFHAKLIPNVDKQTIIGVRVPVLRKFAKELDEKTVAVFLQKLPHKYYEENQLHVILLSGLKDYGQCLAEIQRFLPYIDNWATCDLLRPKVFVKYHEKLIKEIPVWLRSDKTYTVRFGIEMLLVHFLEDGFQKKYLDWVVNIKNEDYYVRMMQAWFFAEAAVKQYESVLPYFEKRNLAEWTHNKAIQKVQESYRISQEHKNYIKSLKMFHVKYFI